MLLQSLGRRRVYVEGFVDNGLACGKMVPNTKSALKQDLLFSFNFPESEGEHPWRIIRFISSFYALFS